MKDAVIRLAAIMLLGLLAGCATERAGQGGGLDQPEPRERSEAPEIKPQPVVTQSSTRQETREPEKTPASGPRATTPLLPKQATVEVRKKPPAHPEVVEPAETAVTPEAPITEIPVTKESHQEASHPKSALRWPQPLSVTQERFLERNENSLLRVYVDMPKSEVMSIMNDYRAGDWINPCKQERLIDGNGRIYDVIFYLSRRPLQLRKFNERLMTPVILRDDRVYAIGRYGLKKLRATSRLVNSVSHGCQHA